MKIISFIFSQVLKSVLVLFLSLNPVVAKEDSGSKEKILIDHVKKSIENAQNGISKITPEILKIDGMSSPVIRHFLNNICSLEGGRYFEIGCWKGSTLVAAVYQNDSHLSDIVAMDNWSEFLGPKNEFHKNITSFLPNSPLKFYEVDCFSVNPKALFSKPVNIYFYDGRHEIPHQKRAFTHYNNILDDVFIAMVDDWNWEDVRTGTMAAFKELKYRILYEQSFFTAGNGDANSWWNGFYIAVIKKPN